MLNIYEIGKYIAFLNRQISILISVIKLQYVSDLSAHTVFICLFLRP